MNTYEREAIGNIILIKNIIFKNTANKKKEVDHAWKFGRPCLVIYSDEQYDYILTITSTQKKKNIAVNTLQYKINISSRNK